MTVIAPSPYTATDILFSCTIAGFSWYDGALVWKELEIGTELQLIAEPNNPVDSEAVAIFHGGRKIGYLPVNHNRTISCIMRQGHGIFYAVVQSMDIAAHPEEQVRVAVKVKKSKEDLA